MDGKCCIAGFGEVMLRLAPPERKRLTQVLPGTLDATFGGSEANVCAALARWGMPCRFLTALPENPVSRACVCQLRGLGCDVSRIRYGEGRMGVYYVEHGSNMRSAGVFYDRENTLISRLGPDEYDMEFMLEEITHLHLSDITCALTEKAFRTVLRLTETAVRKGITLSVDVNNRKKLWNWKPGTGKQELARKCLDQLVPMADWIIGNREDTASVFGYPAPPALQDGKICRDGYRESAERLSGRFPKARGIVFTLRESLSADFNFWGGMLYDCRKKETFFAPLDREGGYAPYAIRDIADRFGGGDAFSAGLLFALHTEGLSEPETALRFATAAGALKHTVFSDYGDFSREEAESLMNGSSGGRVLR